MSLKRVETKLRLLPQELQFLDAQAAANNISRAELIRQRALGTIHPTLSLDTYQRSIEAAARTVSGIPRCQLESIVAAVITTIGKPDHDNAPA